MHDLPQPSASNSALSGQRIFATCMMLALIGSICAAVAGYFFQNNDELLHQIGVSGFFVPDSIALRDTANVYWETQPELDATWQPIIGVVLLYGVGILWGSLAVCGLNIFLVLVAAYYFFKSIKALAIEDHYLLLIFSFVMISVVANIYLIEVMAFPNKEIPLMAITNAYVYYLVVRRSYIAAAILALTALVFRDGYGLILICCLGAVLILRHRPMNIRIAFIGLTVVVFAIFPVSSLMEISSIVARNVEAGSALDQYTNSGVYLRYFSQLIYNTLSLGLLNSYVTEDGKLYLLNIGFWQFGVFIIAGVLWAIKLLLSEVSEIEVGISIVIIITLLCLSYGTFIQPRYLMPLWYFLALGFVRCIKCGGIAVSFSIAVPVILFLSDVIQRLPEALDNAIWSWQ